MKYVITIVSMSVCFTIGCSDTPDDLPELGTVSGIVTRNGEPVEGAQVIFKPSSGSPSVGQTNEAGQYQLIYKEGIEGAVLGQHTVHITKYGEPGSPNDTENQLPDKYDVNSQLTAEVKSGDNEFDFKLE